MPHKFDGEMDEIHNGHATRKCHVVKPEFGYVCLNPRGNLIFDVVLKSGSILTVNSLYDMKMLWGYRFVRFRMCLCKRFLARSYSFTHTHIRYTYTHTLCLTFSPTEMQNSNVYGV